MKTINPKTARSIKSCIRWEDLKDNIFCGLDGFDSRFMPYVKTIDWGVDVYFFGNGIINGYEKDYEPGIYTEDNQIVFILDSEHVKKIPTYLNDMFLRYRNSISCRTLDFRFLSAVELEFTGLRQIEVLRLNQVRHVEWNPNNLLTLRNLQVLDLDRTDVSWIPDISAFPNLDTLFLRSTRVYELNISEPHPNLKSLSINSSKITDCSFLKNLPELRRLSMRNTGITEIPCGIELSPALEYFAISKTTIRELPDLSALTNLKLLDLTKTGIQEINENYLPESLVSLYLSNNKDLHLLPESIGSLSNLKLLDLRYLELEGLPNSIVNLNLPFWGPEEPDKNNKLHTSFGINLCHSKVLDMDMGLFEQDFELIREWFEKRDEEGKEYKLNEVKVIFLGDGGAGKTLSIERLTHDGEIPEDFNGDSTPGISITNDICQLDDRDITIHYWDFGGQEIMHSMHRMFLTKRTAYVVFINVRNNDQDEKAFYWLHNIKSFANESPVLLVLNQIDQNPSASINEKELRRLYPNLKSVIKMSALNDSAAEINGNLRQEIYNLIDEMDSVKDSFLQAWINLKNNLSEMTKYYIDNQDFMEMCDQCKVSSKNDIRYSLIDRFHDLGISFCYKERGLSSYMILKPEWITNAIYILLFNGKDYSKNGMMKIDDIHDLLEGKIPVKSVLDIKYKPHEVLYVLGVIRRFRLSYRVDENYEFFPMLCVKDEKDIINDYVNQENVLEFYLRYEYLPINVFHRLLVEFHHHLKHEQVWLTGALFEIDSMKVSALVKSERNRIHIYAKSKSLQYPASTILNLIRDTICNISSDLGINIKKEFIVYKKDGMQEAFNYRTLMKSFEHGNDEVYSEEFDENLRIEDILNQGGNQVKAEKQKLVEDVISACQALQANKYYWDCGEVERNRYLRDLLNMTYTATDNKSAGKSETGIKDGLLDVTICSKENGKMLSILEAMNLKSLSDSQKEYWTTHFNKLVDNYNSTGLPDLFLVSYVECKKEAFKGFKQDYRKFISHNTDINAELKSFHEWNVDEHFGQCIDGRYDFGGMPVTVYHINVRIGE